MFYTSPNATYTVETELKKRVTEFVDGRPVWTEYQTFEVYLDGEFVTCTVDENLIEELVHEFENGSNIDPAFLTGLTAG